MTVRRSPASGGTFLQSLGALRYIPRFFRLFWQTHPPLTALNITERTTSSTLMRVNQAAGSATSRKMPRAAILNSGRNPLSRGP